MGRLEGKGYFSKERNSFRRKNGAKVNIRDDTRSEKCFLL